MEKYMLISEYDKSMETREWIKKIPELQLDNDWTIKIIPPFGGATVRFQVKKGEAFVSVYLDCYDNLGCYGEPYWEVYPYDGDIYRCDMMNVDALNGAIWKSLKDQGGYK